MAQSAQGVHLPFGLGVIPCLLSRRQVVEGVVHDRLAPHVDAHTQLLNLALDW